MYDWRYNSAKTSQAIVDMIGIFSGATLGEQKHGGYISSCHIYALGLLVSLAISRREKQDAQPNPLLAKMGALLY